MMLVNTMLIFYNLAIDHIRVKKGMMKNKENIILNLTLDS